MENYLIHYGRSKKDGAPGIGTGNWDRKVFVSGSSKTTTEDSGYYRKELNPKVREKLDGMISDRAHINVGDAPGIDRQVQDYLKSKRYNKVTVYGPGAQVRYSANPKWETKPVDDPDHEPGSKEWLAKKDEAMTEDSNEGLAIILDEGSRATRNNIDRLISQNKDVNIFQLSGKSEEFDDWLDKNEYLMSKKVG